LQEPKDQIFSREIRFKAIGVVENEFNERTIPDEIRARDSRIILRPELTDALDGMETGQALIVLYYFHRSQGGPLRQHPRGDEGQPKRGVFMLRTPDRPNPIGVTGVELVAVDENVLRVRGLDAINGSPVLDIKPA
jgi:tRNA-Thr(GGU) m(6)t(6)A37 methyltransferase TsaA